MKITTNASDFIPHILAACKALADRKDEVNKLNVFPVPDGDTGTNMSLTMEAVIKELMALSPQASLVDMQKAITHGSLMGARGNSGVITSQILRGLCDGLIDSESFNPAAVSKALEKSKEVAFSAVRKPVEGTILTVLKDVADAARESAPSATNIQEYLINLKNVAYASVRNTPELLPILKENGVVDAGGYGLALMIDGFISSLTGEISVELETGFHMEPAGKVAIEQINDWEGSEYLYCTEFLFRSDDLDIAAAQAFLTSMGDCELLVGIHPDFKIHVHTNEPGEVLTYMTQRGQVSEVHIHNMKLQSEDRAASLEKDRQDTATAPGAPNPGIAQGAEPKNIGFIAVASGSGMEKILDSLGVDIIVSGGQTMNPSTKDFIDAIEAIQAERIFIFPNNKNIILTANAAAEIAQKEVMVIPTVSVPQSFAALFEADQEASFEENAQVMTQAIGAVRSGEITTAIKDAKSEKGDTIHQGDVIGIMNDKIEVVGEEVPQTALELIGILVGEDADTLTILAGQDMDQDDFEALLEHIEEDFPDLEIDAHRGEQPLYPLVMSVE